MTDFENDDLLNALRQELNSVTPSADFAKNVRDRIAGDINLLREELSAVEPSPEFKVRVRQRIESEIDSRRSAPWFGGWRWVIPVGAVAAVVLGIIEISRPGQPPPVRVVASTPASPVVRPAGVASVPRVAVIAQQRMPSVRVTPGVRLAEPLNGSTGDVASHDPVFEVITNQPLLLAEMWERVSSRTAALASDVAEPVAVGGAVEVSPVEVPPVIVKWLVEPVPAIGPLPLIRRMLADMERSTK